MIDSALGIKLRLGDEVIVVTVGPEHFDRTRGLCGTYNDNSGDDFLDVSGKQAVRAELFANRKGISVHVSFLMNRGRSSMLCKVGESVRRAPSRHYLSTVEDVYQTQKTKKKHDANVKLFL